jgi:hypothetical protein
VQRRGPSAVEEEEILTTADEGALPVDPAGADEEEHFKPTGTIFVLVLFIATLILLWASVFVILLSRGVTL